MSDVAHPMWLPRRLTDGVIVLDPHTEADAEAHWEGEDAEMRHRFEATRQATLDEMRFAMRRWMGMWDAGGPQISYAMRLNGALIGGCELQRPAHDSGQVSYWTYPAWRGKGYAARALALLCDAAANLEGVARIRAHIEPDNLASRGVVTRCGFIPSGWRVDETA